MTKRAYKYRFYPTDEQAELLTQTFGCVRVVYNKILDKRTKAYYDGKQKTSYGQASAMLTALKKEQEFSWLNQVSCVPLQQSLRHQQAAFKNFFEGRAKYPTFKKKHGKQSAEFTVSGFSYRDSKIFMAKSKEPLDIKWSRPLPGKPSSVTISKDCAGRYFISCLCDFDPATLPVTTNTVGIDLGLKGLLITDNGYKFDNPRHTKRYAAKLAKYQRRLSKKKLGSANRAKAKKKVARIHAKISDCRRDNLHKVSRKLVNENQVICAESLKVKNMIRNPKPAKAIADAGWGELMQQLAYKSEWAGRTFVRIDQFFPSTKRCSSCGHIVPKMPLNIRTWSCSTCGAKHDRDINAAKNIKAAGLAVLAFGDTVSLL